MNFGTVVRRAGWLAALLLLAGAALAGTGARAAQNSSSNATIDPANFVRRVDNKFFPLVPGTTFVYAGERDGIPSTTVTEVTHQTKEILGVDTTVVHDRVFETGVLTEDTFDWYAQDRQGNVWYLGEDTKELDAQGNVISTEGSFEAGVNGAQAGIIMEANPRVGDHYQQELAAGVAEDQAQVLNLRGSACVPYGCFDNLLVTKETSALEPGVVDHKYYAEHIGSVLEMTVKGGDEHFELVSVTTQGTRTAVGDSGERVS